MGSRPLFEDFPTHKQPICVVGLGYVGLPLATAFAQKFSVIGLDINPQRIAELKNGYDRTRELTAKQLEACHIEFTTDPAVICRSRFIVVTVPTPIDGHKNPDLTPLYNASIMIGKHIQAGTTVVYESTVYPGCTEEDCLPVIERTSGLKWKNDFFAGYSPERINPGDKEHTVEKIVKVISGDSIETTELMRQIYAAIITAGGVHR